MAVSWVTKADVANAASSDITTLTLSKPAGTALGDVHIFWVYGPSTSSVSYTTPGVWNLIGSVNNSADSMYSAIYYMVDTSNNIASSYTCTLSAASGAGMAWFVFRGVDPAHPIHDYNIANYGAVSSSPFTVTPSAVTTTMDGCEVLTGTAARRSTGGGINFNTNADPTHLTHRNDFGQTNSSNITRRAGSYSTTNPIAAGSWAFPMTASAACSTWMQFQIALQPYRTPVSESDVGTGTESTNIRNTFAQTDTGSGTDTASIKATSNPPADTGSGTDTGSVRVASASPADTGSGTDTGSIRVAVSSSDTGQGTDAVVGIQLGIENSDTGQSNETTSLQSSLTESDDGQGTEASENLQASSSDSEISSSADEEQVTVYLDSSDEGFSDEAESVEVEAGHTPVPGVFNSMLGSSQLGLLALSQGHKILARTKLSVADTGAASDTETLTVYVTDSDSGLSTEANTLIAAISDADISATSEYEDAEVLPTYITDADSGAGLEGLSKFAVQVFNQDIGHSVETQRYDGPPPVVEPGDSSLSSNLVQDPGEIYIAAFGAVEPTNTDVPSDLIWTDLGGTMGGIDLTITQDYDLIQLTQLPDTPIRRIKKRYLSIKTELAEPTLANLIYVLNEDLALVSSGTGYRAFSPSSTISEATPLTYRAVLLRGWAPGEPQKRRTLIIRKGLSIDNIETSFKRDGQTTYTVTWACHYVDDVTSPFRIIDGA